MRCLQSAPVDFGVASVVLLHCNRLHHQNAFDAYANHVYRYNQCRPHPLLVDYWERMHSFQAVRWFYAPIQSIDVPNAKYLTVIRPNATAVFPNCFLMRTQAIHSLRRFFYHFQYSIHTHTHVNQFVIVNSCAKTIIMNALDFVGLSVFSFVPIISLVEFTFTWISIDSPSHQNPFWFNFCYENAAKSVKFSFQTQ